MSLSPPPLTLCASRLPCSAFVVVVVVVGLLCSSSAIVAGSTRRTEAVPIPLPFLRAMGEGEEGMLASTLTFLQ